MLGRRRPLLRAAAVGGVAYHMGKNRGRDQQTIQDQQDQLDQQNSQYQASAASDDASDTGMNKIKELTKMHDSGMLTDEEYAQAKQKVLAQL